METNFKVDVPSFALGYSVGKKKDGSGGGVIEPITIKQNGTYNATDGVDGYAPITVDVAGSGGGGDNTVIDVESLPTENIEQDKIYRIATKTEDGYKCYIVSSTSIMTLQEYFTQNGLPLELVYEVVDEVPTESYEMNRVCILKSTGVPYLCAQGMWMDLENGLGIPCKGYADDINAVTEQGLYTVFTAGGEFTTYGVPNNDDTKTTYENRGNGWVQINKQVIDVSELPEKVQDIRDDAVYRMTDENGVVSYGIPNISENEYKTIYRFTRFGGWQPCDCEKLFSGETTEINLQNIFHLRDYAFYKSVVAYSKLNAPSLNWIGEHAFCDCYNMVLESLPDDVERIDPYAFAGCKKLKLTSLPKALKAIRMYAFNNCTSLAISEIPPEVHTIESNAFSYCTGLSSITFKGTPNEIEWGAFSNCTNLTDIYVPWAEGAVANAPWGVRVTATIHYNHTT